MKNSYITKYKFIFSIFTMLLVSFTFAEEREYPKAIIKNPFPIKGLDWIQGDTHFLYTEEQNVIVRNVETLSIDNIFSASDYDISEASFFPSAQGSDKILVHSKDGNIYTINFPQGFISQFDIDDSYKRRTSKISFNKNGNYIGFGMEDGNTYLMETLQVSNQQFNRLYENNFASPVYTMDFSTDGVYMAVGSETNKINIWDIHKNGKGFVDELYFNSSVKAPVLFSRDSQKIIYAYDHKNIIVKEFNKTQRQWGESDGGLGLNITRIKNKKKKEKIKKSRDAMTDAQRQLLEGRSEEEVANLLSDGEEDYYYKAEGALVIHVDDGILNFKQTHDGTHLIVQTKLNHLRYFNLTTGKQLGYLPNFDVTNITDFALDSQDKKILVSYESGQVFLFNVEDNFFKPNEEPPGLTVFATSGKNGKYKGRNGHQMDFRVNYVYHQDPYPLGVEVDAGYMCGTFKLKPFYTGVFGEFTFSVPNDSYPYEYYYADSKSQIQNPYLFGAGIMIPVGVHIVPFRNPNIYFRTQLDLGVSFFDLWNGAAGKNFIVGSGTMSGSGGCTVGVGYKNYLINVSLKYDSCVGFTVSSGIGYNRQLFNKSRR